MTLNFGKENHKSIEARGELPTCRGSTVTGPFLCPICVQIIEKLVVECNLVANILNV